MGDKLGELINVKCEGEWRCGRGGVGGGGYVWKAVFVCDGEGVWNGVWWMRVIKVMCVGGGGVGDKLGELINVKCEGEWTCGRGGVGGGGGYVWKAVFVCDGEGVWNGFGG